MNQKIILVYAHWKGIDQPELMGNLSVSTVRAKEIFSFEYSSGWLEKGIGFIIDPDLSFYSGPQYTKPDKTNFGIFLDSSPDRWGRVLMKRREAIDAIQDGRSERELLESDFLLGVFDGNRMGALRFKTEQDGEFLDNNRNFATPPWISIRDLEYASLQLDKSNSESSDNYQKWLNMLITPGSSLGGARPKAGIIDKDKNLWIAKFPKGNDSRDIGAWEMIVHELAVKAGINVPECKAEKFSSTHHTFLTKRFDRDSIQQRLHFASAMTMLGHSDGDNASSGVSYLELAEFLVQYGSNTTQDLKELWKRIVFSICISNTDDHLRNHGFILNRKGWQLSPAYDINPVPHGYGLTLNISENDNRLDTDITLKVAPYFRIDITEGKLIIKKIKSVVANWSNIADKYDIPNYEKREMKTAFI
ncbi:MAG: HipA domain-containing protein [Spirochaetia bacterium]|jgi:serine/threonine-protein kinase HipA|nr:HipA domain-containing protein [Spirochaetia bacterium]